MIKKLAHTADWHLKPDKHHRRFEAAIDAFLASLAKELEAEGILPEETLVIVTGDLFDNKSKKQTNEAVDVMSRVLIKITDVYQTIVIIGNHDYDVNNTSSLDCITPIANMFKELGNTNLVYLKNTKHHEHENITFFHYSNFEGNTSPDIKNIKRMFPNDHYIGLFHDIVTGALNFGGMDISEMASHSFDPAAFEGCDAVLMGDIHKHQAIKTPLDIPIVYAGSLHQLHFGENVLGHGYCIWDVESKDYTFVEIDIPWAFYKFSIKDFNDFENGKAVCTNLGANIDFAFKKYSKIRIEWTGLYQDITNAKLDELKDKFIAFAEAKGYKDFPKNKIEVTKNYIQQLTTSKLSDNNASSAILDKVLDPSKLHKNYIEFLKENFPKADVDAFFKIDAEVATSMPSMDDFDTRDRRYKILYIKGENIFSFGEFYRDFQEAKGINLIHSNPSNQGGKSALSRMISFLLFGNKIKYVTSNVTFANIFNKYAKADTAFIEGEIAIDDDIYYLKRVLTKTRSRNGSGVKHKYHIFRYDDERGTECGLRRPAVNLSIQNASVSLKKFEKTIGTYDDYVFASYYEYHNIEKWVATTKTQRYRLFCEYLGLALLESKYQVAKAMLNTHTKQGIGSTYSESKLKLLNGEIEASMVAIANKRLVAEKALASLEEKSKEISTKIKSLYNKKHSIDVKYEIFDLEEAKLDVTEHQEELEEQARISKGLTELLGEYNEMFLDINNEKKYANEVVILSKELDLVEANPELLKSFEALESKLTKVTLSKKDILKEKKTQDKLNEYKVQEMSLANEITLLETQMEQMPDEIHCEKCGNLENNLDNKILLQEKISNKEVELNVIQDFTIQTEGALKIVKSDNDITLKELRVKATTKAAKARELIQTDIDDRKAQIQQHIDSAKETMEVFYEVVSKQDILEVVNGKHENIEAVIGIKQHEINEYLTNNTKIQENIKISKDIVLLDVELEGNSTEIYVTQTEIAGHNKEFNISEYKIEENHRLIEQLKVEYTREQSLRLYLQIHGDDGLSKHIILSILPTINADLAILLNGICDFDLSIRFDDKKIEFIVEKGGVEQQLFESSGLEKTLSCLALHYVNCRMTTLPISNNLILDEILGRVSEKNFHSIISIIKKLCDVFETVDLITHTHGKVLKKMCDNEIIITKEKHISKILN